LTTTLIYNPDITYGLFRREGTLFREAWARDFWYAAP